MFPIISFTELYHMGTLDYQKKKFSYEGKGISVSIHPDEWMHIHRLLSGHLFTFSKSNHAFLNAHSLSMEQRDAIWRWGVRQTFVHEQILYRISWFDGELEDTVYMDFPTLTEAEQELDEDRSMEVVNGFVANDKMNQHLGKGFEQKLEPVVVWDLLLSLYVDMETDLDGVWWEDEFSTCSAPRGVIVPSKIKEWMFKKDPLL